jgi:DNA phosphorothioation-dependent restriction protein DptG
MKTEKLNDSDFEFNMDFALMDQQIEKFKEENSRILNEWYQDCEVLHAQIADLHNINKELEEELVKAKEVLQHIKEQSRNSVNVVVGASLREVICNCLNSIREKIES